MFGQKKKKPTTPSTAESVPPTIVKTIPSVFYGGVDPVIYPTQTSAPSTPKVIPGVTPSASERVPSLPASAPKTLPSEVAPKVVTPKKSKKMWLFVGVFFLLATGGIAVYYFLMVPPATITPPPIPKPPVVTPPTSTVVQIPSSTPPIFTTSTPVVPSSTSGGVFINFPRLFLAIAADADQDSLTDIEEEVYSTDSGTFDTDSDGYFDGQEVVNLYNPTGTAPEKIIDSGLAREYIHPGFGYRIYYPTTWEVDAVDTASQEVLVSAITGDFVSIHSFAKEGAESFETWFARVATGQKYSDLVPIFNRFGVSGWKRRDGLVGYYSDPRFFLVMVYHPGSGQTIVYPRVMEMIIQSFRVSSDAGKLPDQLVIPPVMISSTSSTIPTIVTSSNF